MGFVPREVDLGVHPWDTRVNSHLTFLNGGDSALRVASIRSSCGCTVVTDAAELRGRLVQPGENLGIDFQLDTQKSPGLKERQITLTADNGSEFVAIVTIVVDASWRVTPDRLDLGVVELTDHGDAIGDVVRFQSSSDQLVGEPVADVAWLKPRTAPRADGSIDIFVEVMRDKLPPGPRSGTLFVRTSSTAVPSMPVYVRVNGVAPVRFVPARAFLAGNAPQVIHVFERDGAAAQVVSCVSDHQGVAVSIPSVGKISILNASGVPLDREVGVKVTTGSGATCTLRVSTF